MTMPEANKARSQGRFPRGGARHPVPARHQGGAQGDADGGRPPRDPARGRGGQGRRHRAFHLRHRPQQGGDRGPLRQPVRAGAHAGGARQDGRSWSSSWPSCRGPGQTSFTRQQAPHGLGHAVWCAREIVGDEPFALLLPDMLHLGPRPCLAEMIEAYETNGGNHIAVSPVPRGPDAPLRHRRRRGQEREGLAHHRHGREAEAGRGALQPAHHRPLHPAAGDLRHPRARRARRRRRDPGHRRHDRACPQPAVLRRALRRHDLRLRRPRSGSCWPTSPTPWQRDDLAPTLRAELAKLLQA